MRERGFIMKISSLDKLRDIVYRLLVIHMYLKEENNEEKILIRKMVYKIEDKNILKNLTYVKYIFNPGYLHTKELVNDKFSTFQLYLVLLIVKATNNSVYKEYTIEELIEEFFSDYSYKNIIFEPLFSTDLFYYVDECLNGEYWEDD